MSMDKPGASDLLQKRSAIRVNTESLNLSRKFDLENVWF